MITEIPISKYYSHSTSSNRIAKSWSQKEYYEDQAWKNLAQNYNNCEFLNLG